MHWISFVARRYVSRGRKRSPQALFSVLGIATGALALVVILSVMNGFQLGFIESILEMSSGHLRVDAVPSDSAAALTARLASLSGVVSAAPFREASCLAKGSRAKQPRGVLVRGVPPDVLSRDPGLAARLLTRDGARLEEGAFDLAGPRNIVLGAELARYLDVAVGDAVQLLSISGRLGGALAGDGEEGESEDAPFIVAGVFRCGFYEYDLGWAYINIDSAAALQGGAVGESILIKLKNRWQDAAALERVKKGILEAGYSDGSAGGPRASSWRDYNRAFFSALRTEKLMMFILVGLIFVVVALNIFQAQRRIVLEKRDEIGLLRALGASDAAVRSIFTWNGLVTGLAGSVLGLVPGLLCAFHIQAVFSALETAVNFVIHVVNRIAALGGGREAGEFAVFSTQIFYIKEIPSRVMPAEVIMIFLAGLLSALLAAWFASGKVSRTRPAEVLRYE